jgi:predicted RNase H-like HicB family nuclease
MTIPICVEEIEDRWIAHVADLPGCFAAHHTRHSAIEAVPAAIHEYSAWCSRKGLTIAIPDGAPRVEEIVRAWISEDDYEVNAFFAADRPALSERDTMEIARILDATREDLSAAAARFAPVLEPPKSTGDDPGDSWSPQRILTHVATAENWYLRRLGLGLALDSHTIVEPLELLDVVRRHLELRLPALVEYTGVTIVQGEAWSARKVLRRAVWHERDHTAHLVAVEVSESADQSAEV